MVALLREDWIKDPQLKKWNLVDCTKCNTIKLIIPLFIFIIMKFTDDERIELIQIAEKNGMNRIETNSRKKYFVHSWIVYSGPIFEKINNYCLKNIGMGLNKLRVHVLKYIENDFFERHIDRDENLNFNKEFVFNINSRLNDDYEDGEFFLNDKLYEKPVGEIYHYRSTEYHEVKPITKGIRYSALFSIFESDISDSTKKIF